MASRWSNEHVVAEYKTSQANAMAVDITGRYALLAGRRFLGLVDLENPSDSLKKFPRQSKWEISAVQWNRHIEKAQLFATTCNQRTDICRWTESSCTVEGSLKAHTRVISDLDWCAHEPHMLTTCSVDTYTYIWDCRDYRRPAVSLQAVAGVSQVKWNKVNSHLLATSHDGDVRIWDPRKGTSPVQYIAGHLSKIHGLDWSPDSEYQLASSSQDCSVKFWDVTNPRQPANKLPSGSPVWRARYTPFGKGLVTVVVPQLRRGENSLLLWHLDDLRQPVHSFVGHTDVVLEFQWRKQDTESQDFELVTWSKDQSLRIWHIEPQLQRLCGHSMYEESDLTDGVNMVLSPSSASLGIEVLEDAATNSGEEIEKEKTSTTPAVPISNSNKPESRQLLREKAEKQARKRPLSLQHEFSLVNVDMANVSVEDMDAVNRTFTVSAINGKERVFLTMTFPDQYPDKEPPNFEFGAATTIDKEIQTKLTKVLEDTALQHVRMGRTCIEPCLRHLFTSLQTLTGGQNKNSDSDTPYNLQQGGVLQPPSFLPIYSYGTFTNATVPFPRTSGARFCSSGILVCFTRRVDSASLSRRTSSTTELTPRALSALSAYGPRSSHTPTGTQLSFNFFNMARSPPNDNSMSLFNYFNLVDRKPRQRAKSRMKDMFDPKNKENVSPKKQHHRAGPVIIYNASCLSPVQKQLAENYLLSDDIKKMSSHNASVAAAAGRRDLVQVWSIVALSKNPNLAPDVDPDKGVPWACHPFGRNLVKSLMTHYSQLGDVQTLAMLCCVFGGKQTRPIIKKSISGTPSPSRTASAEPLVQNRVKRFVVEAIKPSKSDARAHPKPQQQLPKRNKTTAVMAPDNYNPYHTIHPSDTSLKGWTFTVPKVRRSNSWSDLFEERMDGQSYLAETEKEQHKENFSLLDQKQAYQFDQFKKAYANILYSWGLLNKRAEILKYISATSDSHQGLELINHCDRCQESVTGAQCPRCKSLLFKCAICHSPVKGSSSLCLSCGHGGHTLHMMEWFAEHKLCPRGCGCQCMSAPPATEECIS